ncbi:MAG: hypothetical protein AAF481_14380 [Acidobacteriota bacterium]
MAGWRIQSVLARFSKRALVLCLLPGLALSEPAAGVAAQPSEGASAAAGEAPAPLNRRDVKRVQREAAGALAAGDFSTAITQFERLVATFPAQDPRRAGALYSLAVASLFRPAVAGNLERATQALEELEDSYPKFERLAEVKLLAAGLRAQAASRAAAAGHAQEVADLQAQVALHQGEAEACSTELANLAEQQETGSEESAAMQAEVRQLRARLAAAEAELKKKEEALEKVKATLVGG